MAEITPVQINSNGAVTFEKNEAPPMVKEVVKTRNFWLLFFAIAFGGVGWAAVLVHQIPYLTSLGVSRETAGFTVIVLTSASIIVRLGFGWLGDTFSKKRSFATAAVIEAVGIFAFSQVHTMWQIVISLAISGIGYGGVIPLRPALQTELFGRKAFGTHQGLLMIAVSIGSVIAPVFVGWVFDTTTSYRFAWLILAIVSLMAIPTVLAIKSPK